MADTQHVVPLSVVEHRLAELERQAQAIDAERKLLLSLKKQAVPLSGTTPAIPSQTRTFPPAVRQEPATVQHGIGDGDRPGASEAVLAYLAARPGHGTRVEEIADALQGRIETSSDNPRRIVVNTVSNLVHRGKLVRNEQGLVFAR